MKKFTFGFTIMLLTSCTSTTTSTTPTALPTSEPSVIISSRPSPVVPTPSSTTLQQAEQVSPPENSDLPLISPTPVPISVVSPPLETAVPTPTHLNVTPSPSSLLSPSKALNIPKYMGDCSAPEGEDVFLQQKTTLNGKVLNEKDTGVFGVAIRVRSLSPCHSYGSEVKTNRNGEYQIQNVPYNFPVEIEVAAPSERSVFYKTQLKSNKESLENVNYFPFRIKKRPEVGCIALAPVPANVFGKLEINGSNLSPDSEALIQLRSIADDCSGFDQQELTRSRKFSFDIYTMGSIGQLSISFAGIPTETREILVPGNRQSPNIVEYNPELNLSTVKLKELSPVWNPELPYYSGMPGSE